jgi:hypothetical protein
MSGEALIKLKTNESIKYYYYLGYFNLLEISYRSLKII